MCTIAGYVGIRPAAPILLEMLKREEGLDAGFYTGIATIHEGKIYYAKVVGDTDRLIAETDAASLPGTVGIIHSRTPGTREPLNCMSHPFISTHNGEMQSALVANGYAGCAKDLRDMPAIGNRLLAEGFEILSRLPADEKPIILSDQTRVHQTDVMAQLVTKHILDGSDPATALEKAYTEAPGEIVALLLSLAEPTGVCWVRMNMPMHLSFTNHGAYLATAPLAFPEDAGETIILPPLSSGVIYRDRYTCQRFQNPPFTVAPITPEVWADAYPKFLEALQERRPMAGLGKLITGFTEADTTQKNVITYGILSDLYRKGLLKIETEYQQGVTANFQAPLFYLSLTR